MGNLTAKTEEIFLNNFIQSELAKISEEDIEKYKYRELIKSQNNQGLFRVIITESFEFIRNIENRSSVSCRDIYRFFKLMDTIYQIKNCDKLNDSMVILLATHLCFLIRIPVYHDKFKLAKLYLKRFKKADLSFNGNFITDFDEFTT
jgi:ribosomal protein S8